MWEKYQEVEIVNLRGVSFTVRTKDVQTIDFLIM